MSWATEYIKKLRAGETVQCRPRGNSMQPLIESGNLCTIEPWDVDKAPLKPGDIVLCTVKGNDYLHLVQAVQQKMGGMRYQIGNNKKGTNGTIGANKIYGKLTRVES